MVTEEMKKYLKENLPESLVTKCGNPECNEYLKVVKEYDDCYFVESIGVKRDGGG